MRARPWRRPAVAVGGVLALGVTVEWLVHAGDPQVVGAIDLTSGLVVALAGAVAWTAAPSSRVGPLLLASAVAWFVGTLALTTTAFGRPDVPRIAAVVAQLHVGLLIHALATWPSGRITRPTQTVLVVGGYLASLFPALWYLDPGYLVLGVLLATGVLLDQRSLSPGRRSAQRPARDAGLFLALAIAASPWLARVADASGWALLAVTADLWAIAVGIVALALAVATVRHSRRGAMADLAVELQVIGGRQGTDELERLVGELSAAEDPSDPALVAAVGRARALSARNRALEASLRARAQELGDSRRRLVEVADEERRVLEERLRSGAAVHVDAVEHGLTALLEGAVGGTALEPPVADRLARARSLLGQARLELDRLASGLDPGRLAERALATALRDLADTSPVAIELAIAADPGPSGTTATTLYFVASEALANVVKHARAGRARLLLRRAPEAWELVVEDDGVGGADPGAGSGLTGLRERVEALGGRLQVTERAGGGTSLTATIPETATGAA